MWARPGDHQGGRSSRTISEVWAWNFDAEFGELLAAVATCGNRAVLALDTEFPGFLREERPSAAQSVRYQALRENVDSLRPIQLGVAVARENGTLLGTWSFNLRFDVAVDLYTEASVAFLTAAGVDFPRHAVEGISPTVMGRRLAASPLVGRAGSRPQWVTFQGWYDLGYLLKLLTGGWPLPKDVGAFEDALAAFFPRRRDLREAFPRGSLDGLAHGRGVTRHGAPHTAGSDALATLELFLQLAEVGEGESSTNVRASGREAPRDLVLAGPYPVIGDRVVWDCNGMDQLEDVWAVQNVHEAAFQAGNREWEAVAATLAQVPQLLASSLVPENGQFAGWTTGSSAAIVDIGPAEMWVSAPGTVMATTPMPWGQPCWSLASTRAVGFPGPNWGFSVDHVPDWAATPAG
mmetsp:Transcript_9957/g.22204  ORF Transcript_9957/g.22204 Transcript_9957/m.22204 type:complete len:406 (+) Transcript_9957:124-1341(+)